MESLFMQAQIDLSRNKRLAIDCLDMIFNQHKPAQAVAQYVGDSYRQHNPDAPDGPQGIVAYAGNYIKSNPQSSMEVKRVMAEGDLVIVHSHVKASVSDRGEVAVDIFRVQNGKLVEHWDVVQPVPPHSANRNGMF